MLIPVVQGRLEKKLTEDLERLKEVLEALMRALLLAVVASLALPGAAAAQVTEAADALRSDPVYVDPEAERADDVDAAALRREIGAKPVYIAVLPASAVEGSPGRTLIALRQAVGGAGTYALVVGDELRTLPADAATSAQPDDLQAALSEVAADAESGEGGGGIRLDPRAPRPDRRGRRRHPAPRQPPQAPRAGRALGGPHP